MLAVISRPAPPRPLQYRLVVIFILELKDVVSPHVPAGSKLRNSYKIERLTVYKLHAIVQLRIAGYYV